MSCSRLCWTLGLCLMSVLAGCATRPVNPPITQADPNKGYRYTTRQEHATNKTKENLVILAFSGGGTRAAAFSYGALEALRRIEVVGPKGNKARLLDEVDVITGVSGGSFTALAYGLYGEKLFDIYETAFLKRNVQGEIIGRVLNPGNWGALSSTGWGRSEIAAQLYDEILFHGATFADLDRGSGPFIVATTTDIATGIRVGFNQGIFDILCSDLDAVPLSRAAAASSAVPFALSPVTINNYGGTCHFTLPPFLAAFSDAEKAPRPAARVLTQTRDLESYEDPNKPYIHLVDGGLSDNLGLRGVLEALEELSAVHALGRPTPFDDVKRIVFFVVNSLSVPDTHWDDSESPPNNFVLLIKATGVPIDHYSYDTVETLRDMIAEWQKMRELRNSTAFKANKDPAIAALLRTPNVELYAIDVSFSKLKDKDERAYLNDLPTSFVLPPEAVDRLRAAAGRIILDSPDFQRLLKEAGASMVVDLPAAPPATAPDAH